MIRKNINLVISTAIIVLLGLNVLSYFSFRYTAINWKQTLVYALCGLLALSGLIFILITRYRPSRRASEKIPGSLLLGFLVFTFLLFFIPFGLNNWFSSYRSTHRTSDIETGTSTHHRQLNRYETAYVAFRHKGYDFEAHNGDWKKVASVSFDEHEGLFGVMVLRNVMLNE